jgi:hypothetical protein
MACKDHPNVMLYAYPSLVEGYSTDDDIIIVARKEIGSPVDYHIERATHITSYTSICCIDFVFYQCAFM